MPINPTSYTKQSINATAYTKTNPNSTIWGDDIASDSYLLLQNSTTDGLLLQDGVSLLGLQSP